MKIIHTDFRKGEAKVKVENQDDLWHLSTLIDIGDEIEGRTFRKIKLGSETERSSNIIKKPVFIKIGVEKIEFGKDSPVLRLSGKTTEAEEEIPKGSYHTFSVEENTIITIIKKQWLKYQADKLKEASKEGHAKILICIFDREEAIFAMVKKYGFEILSSIKGNVQKKEDTGNAGSEFYPAIVKQLQDYKERLGLSQIILASPSFWKEYLLEEMKDNDLKKIIIQATCSSVDGNGINEVLKRPEVNQALQQERAAQEMKYVEKLLGEISKNGLSVYGLKQTAEAVEAGAVEILLVTDALIQKTRQENTFHKIDAIMKNADATKAEVHIISVEHEGGQRLHGLGGIGGILRYRLSYS